MGCPTASDQHGSLHGHAGSHRSRSSGVAPGRVSRLVNVHAVVVLGLIVVGVVVFEALVWSRAKLAGDVCGSGWMCPGVNGVTAGIALLADNHHRRRRGPELDLQEYRLPFELVDLPFWLWSWPSASRYFFVGIR